MNWKAPPADPTMKWVNRSMEMQILLACNWNCCACDQHSNYPGISFVRKATMTTHQVESFIDEMCLNRAYIGRIRLVGGEPTMHPKFTEIVHELHKELVGRGLVGRLECVTNGSKMEKFEEVKGLVKVRVSDEADKQKSHVANLPHTPASLGYEGKMCSAPWHCGFSLNYYGYFPCSSGAGIARLTDQMMPWQRLSLPVEGIEKTWPDLQQLCNQCYHALRPEDKVRCGTQLYQLNQPGPETWPHLAQWLNGKQPDWPIYGQVV